MFSLHKMSLRLLLLPAGLGLTDRQLQAEVGTFIMGGFETTAHTLSFTLFCIATNPDVEKKIAEELQDLGLLNADGTLGRPISAEDLSVLSYLGNVIRESMRIFPVVAGFPRYPCLPTSHCLSLCACASAAAGHVPPLQAD